MIGKACSLSLYVNFLIANIRLQKYCRNLGLCMKGRSSALLKHCWFLKTARFKIKNTNTCLKWKISRQMKLSRTYYAKIVCTFCIFVHKFIQNRQLYIFWLKIIDVAYQKQWVSGVIESYYQFSKHFSTCNRRFWINFFFEASINLSMLYCSLLLIVFKPLHLQQKHAATQDRFLIPLQCYLPLWFETNSKKVIWNDYY